MKKLINYSFILAMSLTLGSACTDIVEETTEPIETRAVTDTETSYYWYDGQKIPLTVDTDKKFVLVDASAEPMLFSAGASSEQAFADVSLSPSIVKLPRMRAAATEPKLKWTTVSSAQPVTRSAVDAEVIYEAPYFRTEEGYEVGLSHLLYVKLKDKGDESVLLRLAADNGVEVIGYNEFMPLWYTLSCSSKSMGNALEMANRFYETGLFAAAEPSFVAEIVMNSAEAPNDPLFQDQWNLENTGQWNINYEHLDINYLNAKKRTQGDRSVVVAVIDCGVMKDHPDLNITTNGFDVETGNIPSAFYGIHGTQCAGLIAAQTDNGIGLAGIAPKCQILPISFNDDNLIDIPNRLANAFRYAFQYGASVISNSWELKSTRSEMLENIIRLVMTQGRNGLGCVVVFASGNDDLPRICYPASALEDIIVVGALTSSGKKLTKVFPSAPGSNYGEGLDVVAPGSWVPVLNKNGGYTEAEGTSYAAPQVAGVAALMLTVNPKLTQKQVGDLINSTAAGLGEYHFDYAGEFHRPNLPYTTRLFENPLDKYYKRKVEWHEEVGYGLVDADRAVVRALLAQYTKPITPPEE